MKKAKLVLAAMSILGIAGVALASRAHRGGSFELFGCDPNTHLCTKDLGKISPGNVDPAGPFSTCGVLGSHPLVTCVDDCDCGTTLYRTDL